MNVSDRWLREIAPGIREDVDTLAERLGMLGAPVEEIVRPGEALDGVVVGRVVESGSHPKADRLSLCRVDAGDGEPLQVVCGAPNVEAGALYPFAPVGVTLPGGMTIRRAKIRGEYSEGMLCSEQELGLGRDAAGILRLPDALRVGAPLVEALGLEGARLTLEVTPNRPDLLSMVGVARELAPGGQRGVQLPPFPGRYSEDRTDAELPPLELRRGGQQSSADGVPVRIEDPERCPRYIGVVLEDVEVGPSPAWLAGRLRAIGQRPINNVVDATNYILHELGQPLHAFDLDRLAGPEIRVRLAGDGESITTLDDVERRLRPDMLVIADAERPVAIAGVMGGADSEVGPETSRVLLECAHFEPGTIRSTARALGLSTDASYRFERGTDIDGMDRAAHRAAELIQAVAGGRVRRVAADVYPDPTPAPELRLRASRVRRVLGAEIPAGEAASLLDPLGFEVVGHDDETLTVRVPGYRRHDVTREVDLIEEVARRYGYDRFADELQPYRPTRVPDAPLLGLEDRLRDFFAGAGLLEARSVSMAPEGAGTVQLLKPLSAEEGFLRSTLAFGLLRAVELNHARGVRDVRLFELGTTFHPVPEPGSGPAGEGERGSAGGAAGEGRPREETRAAVVLTGRRRPRHWSGEAGDFDLWDLRGLAESLLRELDPAGGSVGPLGDEDPGTLALPATFRPGTLLALRSGDTLVGVAGEVADEAVDAPAWAGPAFALEVRLDRAMAHRERPAFSPLPNRPASDRDLALLVPAGVPSAAVAATIRDAGGPLLESVAVFDVYTGTGVPEGVRSIAYRLVFRHPERTLTDREVDEAVAGVLAAVEAEHGVERRG